ncbi:hypothetical protein AAVH_34792, partial [Aphelenchoides avenae]
FPLECFAQCHPMSSRATARDLYQCAKSCTTARARYGDRRCLRSCTWLATWFFL